MTVSQVATTLAQHPNTVREHLEALARAGLARRDQLAPVGRGRPASVYTYAPEASFTSPEYAVLAKVIVSYLAHTLPDGPLLRHHAREAGRHWGRTILERAEPAGGRTGGRGAGAAVAGLRRMLEKVGFAPETTKDHGTYTLRLPRCPVLELAAERPDVVCNAHLGMAREILAAGDVDPGHVTLEAFAEPGGCLLHVAARRDAATVGDDEGLRIGPRPGLGAGAPAGGPVDAVAPVTAPADVAARQVGAEVASRGGARADTAASAAAPALERP